MRIDPIIKVPHGISGPIFEKVLEFCDIYRVNGCQPPNIPKPLKSNRMCENTTLTYAAFIDQFDDDTVQDLINAGDTLEMKPLLTLATAKMGSVIRGLSVVEFRKRFSIVNDLTPEEERIPMDSNMLLTLAVLEAELDVFN